MTQYAQNVDDAGGGHDAGGLVVRPVDYAYRYCPGCRREWPAQHASCPACQRWLGDRPLARTEWQLTPAGRQAGPGDVFRAIGASALILRLVLDARPGRSLLEKAAAALDEALGGPQAGTVAGIADHGWLAWNADGLRAAFLQGLELHRRLAAAMGRLDDSLPGGGCVRWGLWLDHYVISFGRNGMARVPPVTARAIFDFEADNFFLCSQAVYEANRHWEHFVCVPRRLAGGAESQGYRHLDHKRPSALDHAQTPDAGPFVGRTAELAFLDECLRQSRTAAVRAALFASAGSGKTRLVRHWRGRHLGLRVLAAGFSLFGGDAASFAVQLAELPARRVNSETLLASILERIRADRIDALVLDDLHWADPASLALLEHLLAALQATPVLVLLVARPSGRALVEPLRPTATLDLPPLPASAAQQLAQTLAAPGPVASAAAQRSMGNPLFVEQFLGWAAETGYQGTGAAPLNLHQLIAARIDHLSGQRLSLLRQRLYLTSAFERAQAAKELDEMQDEIGLWLDRLETGDYGDRVEVARYLGRLERIDFETFLAKAMIGKPHARSSRLREAIERLLAGSAEQILADLQDRTGVAGAAERTNILMQAQRVGEVLAQRFQWKSACACYELALEVADPDLREEPGRRLAQCRRHCLQTWNETDMDADSGAAGPEANPAVDALRLPEVWIRLALHDGGRAEYFGLAAQAAEAINDRALAQWARRREAEALRFKAGQ